MNKVLLKQLGIALALILATAGLRVVPHMPNVAPVAAVALVAGAFLPAAWAWLVPITAMGLSDLVIGGYDVRVMTAVYGSFAVMAIWGAWLKKRSVGRIIASAVGVSVMFYLVTNLAVWKFGGLYEQTWNGLVLCYTYALPFFRVNLLGNLAYTAGLFGLIEVVLRWLELADKVRVQTGVLRKTHN